MTTGDLLEKEFKAGKVPKSLDGFYRGELTLLLPAKPLEHIGGIISKLYLPWKGKTFDGKKGMGDNSLSRFVASLLTLGNEKSFVVKEEGSIARVFPFKTKITQSVGGKREVFQLDYNLSQNPPLVQTVIDELVEVGRNSYLGKAFLREGNSYRLVAFFRLFKR